MKLKEKFQPQKNKCVFLINVHDAEWKDKCSLNICTNFIVAYWNKMLEL